MTKLEEKLRASNGHSKDMRGYVRGKVTVIDYVGDNKYGDMLWRCRCSCGNEFDRITAKLTSKRIAVPSCPDCAKRVRALDILGKKFNRLTAIEVASRGAQNQRRYLFKCGCGREKIVMGALVHKGYVKSCGCLLGEITRKRVVKNLAGKVSFRWTVLDQHKMAGSESYWLCRCECGTEKFVAAKTIISGKSKSCGCLCAEEARARMTKYAAGYKHAKGPDHPFWNPALTDEDRRRQRWSSAVTDWGRAIYARDHYHCQACMQRSNKLCAHHLVPWSTSKELRFDLSNGITLCVKCHREYHGKYPAKIATPQNFLEFKLSKQKELSI